MFCETLNYAGCWFLGAKMESAYHNYGDATCKKIVKAEKMKKAVVRAIIELVLPMNSGASMENAFWYIQTKAYQYILLRKKMFI